MELEDVIDMLPRCIQDKGKPYTGLVILQTMKEGGPNRFKICYQFKDGKVFYQSTPTWKGATLREALWKCYNWCKSNNLIKE